jgi:hypothetical protein
LQKQVEPERNEPELKALFQTMRQADAERAPSFAQTLRAVPERGRVGYLRVMVAVAVVILLVIGVNALRGRDEKPMSPQVSARVATSAGESPASTGPLVTGTLSSSSVGNSGGGTPPRQPAGRRRSDATAAKKTSVPSITKWKSPTDALLKFPGDELMSGVPKIGFTQQSGKTAE